MNWKEQLYNSLRAQPKPVFVFGESIISGANLWSGARVWTRALREAGVKAGDRILISSEASQSFLWILIASLCEELTIALLPPDLSADELRRAHDLIDPAALVLSRSAQVRARDTNAVDEVIDGAHVLTVDSFELPEFSGWRARKSIVPANSEIRLILRTSGSVSTPRFIALSDRNIFSVISSHHACMNYSNQVLLSVLPWFHAFGLILELLPALLFQSEVFRDPACGRDPEALAALFDAWDFTHMNGVPAVFERLLPRLSAGSKLANLQGIVGGAAVSAELAERLRETRLRAGYGQTQAAPGITLGNPGEWSAAFLGRPVGCEVRQAEDGELEFRGANVCLGEWSPEGLAPGAGEDEFFATGDIVEQRDDGFYFRARKGFAFKLPNARWFHPEVLEARLKTELNIPGDCVVLLHPQSGRLAIVCDDQQAIKKIQASLAAARGPGGSEADDWPGRRYIETVHHLSSENFPRKAKGDPDRVALRARLSD
ncbi:MAG: acyl--CoA ligase [bacterium]|nr:acyl--CoA ligase [bacterium]